MNLKYTARLHSIDRKVHFCWPLFLNAKCKQSLGQCFFLFISLFSLSLPLFFCLFSMPIFSASGMWNWEERIRIVNDESMKEVGKLFTLFIYQSFLLLSLSVERFFMFMSGRDSRLFVVFHPPPTSSHHSSVLCVDGNLPKNLQKKK